MRTLYLLLCALFLFVGCKNDDDNSNTAMQEDDGPMITEVESLSLVTGVRAREIPDQEFFVLGNPNVFVDGQTLTVFPTLTRSVININALGVISDVWLVPAEEEKIHQGEDFSTIYNSGTYAQSEITTGSVITVNDIDQTNVSINLKGLTPGYYRVFATVNGQFQWENIKILNDTEDIDDLIEFWN
ncbi:hypothetical protein POV27_13715 [Aureisphaera galaxeae]|uniref:hypothetical protein n=1 Tax=Aureisphaera galaxeae TaxID=1538023 RepID=UPI002350260B|nr:hypothetical protein [Aureisphaera galaxeae]MDC8005114.1 hypothetical protein [Aureisphaera galaxeae]